MESLRAEDFDLARTLECGQFFRYAKADEGYIVSHRDVIFRIRQEGDDLTFSGAPKEFIRSFFRLEEDYTGIIESISKDEYIKEAIHANKGLRLIRQDPWECLVSYICSSNSNIPKIRMNLNLLSKRFGKKISDDNYSFPNPGELDDHDAIRSCKVGFRSRFIHDANREAKYEWLVSLKGKSYEEARSELKRLNGVGDKIADCVCLFSLDKLEAFPVDVWIARVIRERYMDGKEEKKERIAEWGRSYFGRYAGYANQFLFHYRRTADEK
jgi:N-glycosylase/DNA lyase